MLHYILQIVIFQLIFLIIYDLFHKKETFFNWNRVYLIITPFLSLLLPFIKFKMFKASNSQVIITRLERVLTESSQNLQTIGTSGSELDYINWWLVAYFVGVGISLLLLVLKFHKLNILKRLSLQSNQGEKKIVVLPNTNQAFSFWNTIYLGDGLDEEEKKRILIHELVHVEQKHSVDQLLFELLKIVLWWNPLIYYYQFRITELHEYLADAAVITTIDKRNYIDQLLNAAFQTQEVTFVNQFFNESLIKKRIMMLQKNKSKAVSKFKYLLLIPVVTGILAYTSCSDSNGTFLSSTSENNSESDCLNQNSTYDKKIDNFLKINTEKNSEVIVDLVNIETKEIIRRAHIEQMQSHTIKNIPEGKYRLTVIYGEGYTEETVNGVCEGYLERSFKIEAGEDIIDFNNIITDSGVDVPSYEISVDIAEPETSKSQDNQDVATTTIEPSTFACLNKDAVYDKNMLNYLELSTAANTEIIADLVSMETGKSIRTVHLKEKSKTFIKNIPSGKYKLHNQYGTKYAEKNENGKCMASFENLIEEQKKGPVFNFTPEETENGIDVPSYAIMLDNN